MYANVLTIANIISLSRALMAYPIIFMLNKPEYYWYMIGLLALAFLSDALDGYFARKAQSISILGKVLDPLADFVLISSILFYMSVNDLFPMWFFLLYMVRAVSNPSELTARLRYQQTFPKS